MILQVIQVWLAGKDPQGPAVMARSTSAWWENYGFNNG